MTTEGWIRDHPKEYRTILDTLALRVLMSNWSDLHPVAHKFQRKIVQDLADDIITIVMENNR